MRGWNFNKARFGESRSQCHYSFKQYVKIATCKRHVASCTIITKPTVLIPVTEYLPPKQVDSCIYSIAKSNNWKIYSDKSIFYWASCGSTLFFLSFHLSCLIGWRESFDKTVRLGLWQTLLHLSAFKGMVGTVVLSYWTPRWIHNDCGYTPILPFHLWIILHRAPTISEID